MSYLTSPGYPKIHWRISKIVARDRSHSSSCYNEIHCSVLKQELMDIFGSSLNPKYNGIYKNSLYIIAQESINTAHWYVGDIHLKKMYRHGVIVVDSEKVDIVFYGRKDRRII